MRGIVRACRVSSLAAWCCHWLRLLSCWLGYRCWCGAVLWGRSALAAWCCVRRVVVRVSVSFRGAVSFACWLVCWCVAVCGVVLPSCCVVCLVCWSTVCASSSARHALLLLLLSYCLHCLPSASPTVCHPSSVRRSLESAAPRSLCVSSDTYHYRCFHNYLMITVTYNLLDNGI